MAAPVRYRCSRDVEVSTVATRVVLYHRGSRKAIVLNPTGSTLWTSLGTPRTEQELADALREKYPLVSPEQSLIDASAFVASLRTEGLIEVTG